MKVRLKISLTKIIWNKPEQGLNPGWKSTSRIFMVGECTVRIIYTHKLKFLKYYVIHTLDFRKPTTIQFSFKKGVYQSKKKFVSNFLFIEFLNLKVMLNNNF